jgi:hypothetical protein
MFRHDHPDIRRVIKQEQLLRFPNTLDDFHAIVQESFMPLAEIVLAVKT